MEDLLVYECQDLKLFFEPRTYLPDGYIEGKTGLNSMCLQSQVCPLFKFYHSYCRNPTFEERNEYQQLKNAHLQFNGVMAE